MRQSFFALNMTILPKRYRMGYLRHIVTHIVGRTMTLKITFMEQVSSMQQQSPLFPHE